MTRYAVTGATGQLGRLAVAELLARGVDPASVVAIVRSPDRAGDLAARGVDVRAGDYERPETLSSALSGVDRLLFVSGSEVGRRIPQHRALLDAAVAAGVGHVVYTSLPHADVSANPLAPEHRATEEMLADSGLGWSVVRNNWYLENYTVQLPGYLARGEISGRSGTARIAGAARADYAAAAVAVLLDDGDQGVVYELGGHPFSLGELAETITRVTGSTVSYRDRTPAELQAGLVAAGLDADTADLVVALEESTARGDLDGDADTLTTLLGREPAGLEEAVRAAHAALGDR